MGYESKIIVVRKSAHKDDDGVYGEFIALFNLGGNDWSETDIRDLLGPKTDCCFYMPEDGNKQVKHDAYGDPIKEINLDKLIDYLAKGVSLPDAYRRLKPALHMLYAFKQDIAKWPGLTVLHYGY